MNSSSENLSKMDWTLCSISFEFFYISFSKEKKHLSYAPEQTQVNCVFEPINSRGITECQNRLNTCRTPTYPLSSNKF
ncbi:MAG: hypothetical protein ACI8ZO_001422 [Flavobacteriales bacterium]|jgi:hypothetical protein